MRLNINLASVKYEDVRQFFIRWTAAVAALAALAIMLAGLSYFKYSRSTASGRQTRDLQGKIAALEKQRAQAVAFDNRPENRDVTQQKKFWNTQIARRLFSWTQLFNDLQKIMPRRAFLDSVQPELTPENRLKLKLTITGEKKENARELVEKMENSTRFHSPRIVSENVEKERKPGAVPNYKFEIETYYAPAASAPLPPPEHIQRGQGNLASPHPGAKEGV
jgi:hypothetical protein